MANRPAAGVGGGGVLKVNTTSSDNTLAFPIPPKPANSNSKDYSYSKPLQAKNVNPNDVGNTQVAGGGSILKSNYTSSENPLSFGGGGPNGKLSTFIYFSHRLIICKHVNVRFYLFISSNDNFYYYYMCLFRCEQFSFLLCSRFNIY